MAAVVGVDADGALAVMDAAATVLGLEAAAAIAIADGPAAVAADPMTVVAAWLLAVAEVFNEARLLFM